MSPSQIIMFPVLPKQQDLPKSWYLPKNYTTPYHKSPLSRKYHILHKEGKTHGRTLSGNLYFQSVKKALEDSLPLTLQLATGS